MARRRQPRLRLTDTTFRDGNQSLFGGRLRGAELVPIARKLDGAGFAAFEAFGGATFETYLRLGEDPWEYLRELAAATPNTPIQALIRGQNLVGQRNYADDAVELFVTTAAGRGVEIFRIFDPLNDLRNMEVAIRSAKKAGRLVQGALSYAISPVHVHDLWISQAKGLAAMGVDELVIKDTSGLLSPQAAWELVSSLKKSVRLPVLVHSHCSSGMAPMAYMAAIEAGAAGVDTALSPLAWGASQPAAESVIAALAGGDWDTGIELERLLEARDELRALKERHGEDQSTWVDRIDADILHYQMPGFMLEDIQARLDAHDAGVRLKEALEEVPRVRAELGYPPLVAPIRELIAAQAVYNVLGGERYATVTQEMKDYLQGLYGTPPRPADVEVRRLVLGREEPITIRPADLLEPQVELARAQLLKLDRPAGEVDTLNFLLFPALATENWNRPDQEDAAEGGPAAAAPAGAGSSRAEPAPPAAAAPPVPPAPEPAPAVVASEFQVEVEGELFTVRVTGAGPPAVSAAPAAGSAPAPTPGPAPRLRDGVVAAPMQGLIVKVPVKPGDEVALGDVVAVLEAMKMQNDIVTVKPGRVLEVYVREGDVVKPNQPLVAVG